MKLYAVRNRDGQWFKRKGYGGYGETWRDTLEQATFYQKLSQARSRVTYFLKNWPDHGVPELVEFELGEPRVIVEEATRAKTAVVKREKREAEMERRREAWRHHEDNWRRGRLPGETRE